MTGSLSAELLKLRKRPATWVLGAILVIGLLLLYGLLYVGLKASEASTDPNAQAGVADLREILLPEGALSFVLGLLATLGGPVALILGALVAGSEYGWGTMKTIITQRVTRLGVLSGKVLGLAVVLVIFSILMFLVALVSSFLVAQIEGLSTNFPSFVEILGGFAAALLIMAAWAALGFGLASVFRSTALAIGLGLIYALVLETIVNIAVGFTERVEPLRDALLGFNASALAASFGENNVEAGGPPVVSPTQATLVLIAYVVVLILVSALVLKRRDVA